MIQIDRSANHCHLTRYMAVKIFGDALHHLQLKELAITGEYATNLKVTDYRGNKYTVLYPWRDYSQIEVAASDYYKLFSYHPTRRSSGDLISTKTLQLEGTEFRIPVIVVRPHIHIPPGKKDTFTLAQLDFPFKLDVKYTPTTDNEPHIHLDTDQYAAIQGI